MPPKSRYTTISTDGPVETPKKEDRTKAYVITDKDNKDIDCSEKNIPTIVDYGIKFAAFIINVTTKHENMTGIPQARINTCTNFLREFRGVDGTPMSDMVNGNLIVRMGEEVSLIRDLKPSHDKYFIIDFTSHNPTYYKNYPKSWEGFTDDGDRTYSEEMRVPVKFIQNPEQYIRDFYEHNILPSVEYCLKTLKVSANGTRASIKKMIADLTELDKRIDIIEAVKEDIDWGTTQTKCYKDIMEG